MKFATQFTVLTPDAFIEDVRHEADRAKHRVWAQAMDVEPGEIADGFFHIFLKSADRGLDTRFHADYFSLMVTDGVFDYLPPLSRSSRRKRLAKKHAKYELARKLREAGVKVLFTNPPTMLDRLFPVRGRNHMKIVVVDEVAWIGGVNFSDAAFKARDCMIKLTEPQLVKEVAYVYEQVDREEQLRDMAIDCDEHTKLLVDGGRINRSLILRHTVELVTRAEKSLKIVSPLIPDADLLTAVKRAMKRGLEVEIIAPQSIKMTGIFVILDEFNGFIMRLRGGGLPIRFKSKMIHAKIIIADDREVIVGSHNLSSRGVRMGTEEIALRSTDPTLIKNLSDFYNDLHTLK